MGEQTAAHFCDVRRIRTLSGDIAKLFLIGLPALALGTWRGFKLYGRLDDATFRRAVLVLISGVTFIV